MTRIHSIALLGAAALLAACAGPAPAPGKPEYMVVGIDNKVIWGDDGKLQNLAPGKDAVTIVDIGTRSREPEDRRQPAADELDLRPADQPGDHAERPARAGRQLDGLGRGRRRLEAGAGQQALRDRPHDQPAAR